VTRVLIVDDEPGLLNALAINLRARGFAEAMNATLTPSRTPDGGLTMTLSLPGAP
jgi:hypothetical protein